MPTLTSSIQTRTRTRVHAWPSLRWVSGILVVIAFGAGAGPLLSQSPEKPAIPIWPDDGRAPAGMDKQYVFMAKEGDALVFLVPVEPGDALDGPKKAVRVPLHNQVMPSMRTASVARNADGVYRYSYEVCNASTAKDPIEVFRVPEPVGDRTVCMTHQTDGPRWTEPCSPKLAGLPRHLPGTQRQMYAAWMRNEGSPAIEPGECLGRFQLDSDRMPGFMQAEFSTFITRYQPDRTWPEEVFHQAAYYEERTWFQKDVLTIGPALSPGAGREETAANFNQGLSDLVKEGRLRPESPFVQELRRKVETLLTRDLHPDELKLNAKPSTQEELSVFGAAHLSLKLETITASNNR